MKNISIIVPFYNEQKVVNVFFKELENVLKNIKDYQFQCIFINDGSTDETLNLLKALSSDFMKIKIINFSRNFGHESAINAGINNCQSDAAIIMDGDLQDPPKSIPEILDKYSKGYDVVNCHRISRQTDTSFKRNTAGTFYKIAAKLSDKIPVENKVNNFRLISSKVIDVVKNLTEKNRVFRFQIPFAGFKTASIEIVREERASGKTHYNIKSMSKLAIDSIISISTKPLLFISKLFIVFLITAGLSSLTEAILFTMQWLTHSINIDTLGYYVWLIINVLLILSRDIILTIAIIAQYIARIHIETQNRPNYIIDSIINNN